MSVTQRLSAFILCVVPSLGLGSIGSLNEADFNRCPMKPGVQAMVGGSRSLAKLPKFFCFQLRHRNGTVRTETAAALDMKTVLDQKQCRFANSRRRAAADLPPLLGLLRSGRRDCAVPVLGAEAVIARESELNLSPVAGESPVAFCAGNGETVGGWVGGAPWSSTCTCGFADPHLRLCRLAV